MLSHERQSARMSKITNNGLTWSGTGCFIALYPYGNSGRQRVNLFTIELTMLCIVHRRVINLWHIRWWWPIVCFSFLFIHFLFLTTCARLSWPHSAFVSTLNSSVVSYRIVSGMEEQKLLAYNAQCVYTVWVKKIPPAVFWHFPKRMGIFNQFLHTYYTFLSPFYTRLQILIQLSPTLTKLCHTKCDHPTNFYISLEV